MLVTEMEIVKRELNDVKETIKEKSEHEGLLSSLSSFPSLAEVCLHVTILATIVTIITVSCREKMRKQLVMFLFAFKLNR